MIRLVLHRFKLNNSKEEQHKTVETKPNWDTSFQVIRCNRQMPNKIPENTFSIFVLNTTESKVTEFPITSPKNIDQSQKQRPNIPHQEDESLGMHGSNSKDGVKYGNLNQR